MADKKDEKRYRLEFKVNLELPALTPGGKKILDDLAKIKMSFKPKGSEEPASPWDVNPHDIAPEAERIAKLPEAERVKELTSLLEFLLVVMRDAQWAGEWGLIASTAIAKFPDQIKALQGAEGLSIKPLGRDSPDI